MNLHQVALIMCFLFLTACTNTISRNNLDAAKINESGKYSEMGSCVSDSQCYVVSDCNCGYVCASTNIVFEKCPERSAPCVNQISKPKCGCVDKLCKIIL